MALLAEIQARILKKDAALIELSANLEMHDKYIDTREREIGRHEEDGAGEQHKKLSEMHAKVLANHKRMGTVIEAMQKRTTTG